MQREAELSARAFPGEVDPATLAASLDAEWNSLRVLLTVAAANVILAIWRPRLTKASGLTLPAWVPGLSSNAEENGAEFLIASDHVYKMDYEIEGVVILPYVDMGRHARLRNVVIDRWGNSARAGRR